MARRKRRSEAGGGEATDAGVDRPNRAASPPTLPLPKSDVSDFGPSALPNSDKSEFGGRVDARCAFVALIGAPNAGKSTLINALVGAKVSIVSRKVQTTRALIRGIAIEGAAQLVFMDTPGIFAPRRRLDRAMVTTAWSGAGDADIVTLLIDAKKGIDEEAEAILAKLGDLTPPKVLVLNKVDLVDKPALLTLAEAGNA